MFSFSFSRVSVEAFFFLVFCFCLDSFKTTFSLSFVFFRSDSRSNFDWRAFTSIFFSVFTSLVRIRIRYRSWIALKEREAKARRCFLVYPSPQCRAVENANDERPPRAIQKQKQNTNALSRMNRKIKKMMFLTNYFQLCSRSFLHAFSIAFNLFLFIFVEFFSRCVTQSISCGFFFFLVTISFQPINGRKRERIISSVIEDKVRIIIIIIVKGVKRWELFPSRFYCIFINQIYRTNKNHNYPRTNREIGRENI